MHAVMLKKDWPSAFARNVRDEDGKILKRLEFSKGQPQLLDDAEFAAVAGDSGKALVLSQVVTDAKTGQEVPTGKEVAAPEMPKADPPKHKRK